MNSEIRFGGDNGMVEKGRNIGARIGQKRLFPGPDIERQIVHFLEFGHCGDMIPMAVGQQDGARCELQFVQLRHNPIRLRPRINNDPFHSLLVVQKVAVDPKRSDHQCEYPGCHSDKIHKRVVLSIAHPLGLTTYLTNIYARPVNDGIFELSLTLPKKHGIFAL